MTGVHIFWAIVAGTGLLLLCAVAAWLVMTVSAVVAGA